MINRASRNWALAACVGLLSGCVYSYTEIPADLVKGVSFIYGAPKSVPASKIYDQLASRSDAQPLTVAHASAGAQTYLLGNLRDGVGTYYGPDGQSISLRDGVIVSTRAVGRDLMSADVDQSLALIRTGQGGQVQRFHSYRDDHEQIITRSYVCDITAPKNARVIETCHSATGKFTNSYRVAAGRITGSTQVIDDRGAFTIGAATGG